MKPSARYYLVLSLVPELDGNSKRSPDVWYYTHSTVHSLQDRLGFTEG